MKRERYDNHEKAIVRDHRPEMRVIYFRILAEMINSMARDLACIPSRTYSGGDWAPTGTINGKRGAILSTASIAKSHLFEFKNWNVYEIAVDLGFYVPSDKKIQDIINKSPDEIKDMMWYQHTGNNLNRRCNKNIARQCGS